MTSCEPYVPAGITRGLWGGSRQGDSTGRKLPSPSWKARLSRPGSAWRVLNAWEVLPLGTRACSGRFLETSRRPVWAPFSPRGPLAISEAEADSKLAARVLRKARQETLLSGPGDKERALPRLTIVEEINPEYSLEGLMLQIKFQYFGHLI